MKLLRATFENFRMLRDLELEFSGDDTRNLTVVRAANESGKTTILHALQWALYGDDALPNKGKEFRLHPIDWDIDDGKRVMITAKVEFELTRYRSGRVGGDTRETKKRYQIIRSTSEEVDSKGRRQPSEVQLLELNHEGATPIEVPKSMINEELPPELREVFFTDGDRALSFIEAGGEQRPIKREHVQRAIRSLLGLGVIEDAIKHVKHSATEANREAKKAGAGKELEHVVSSLESNDKKTAELELNLNDSKQQFAHFDLSLIHI